MAELDPIELYETVTFIRVLLCSVTGSLYIDQARLRLRDAPVLPPLLLHMCTYCYKRWD